MKLSPALAKYLAANKRLSLPRIGTFTSEGSYDPEFDGKRTTVPANVSFKNEKVHGFDDALVEFIAKETGKMKILAESDLTSQLDDVLQYLNTGKPYFFTDIGTLARKQNGDFEFFAEKYTPASEKKKEKDIPITEKNYVPQTYIDNTRTGRRNLKPALIIITLALIAIAATVWIYMNSMETNLTEVEDAVETVPAQAQAADSLAAQDSARTATVASSTYTYVLEVAREPRASRRFNQLKTINWPVELEVLDSVSKRIVMKLPRAGADTARIKDSLSVLSGRKVSIAP